MKTIEVNNVLFLYEYFKALKKSKNFHPHEVNCNGKNYLFRNSRHDMENIIVEYEFDQLPKMMIRISFEEYDEITKDMFILKQKV